MSAPHTLRPFIARALPLVAFGITPSCEPHSPPPPEARSATAISAPPSARPAPAPSAPSSPPPTAGPPPPPPPASTPCHVALIGDSITDFASFGGGYVRYLEARSPHSVFENFAKGGTMVNQMRKRLETVVLPDATTPFSHVVVFGGVNDLYSDETAGRTVAKIEADLSAMYAAARAHGARVVAITVAPWGGFSRWYTPHRADTTRELNAWIRAQRGAGKVDATADAYALLSCGVPDHLCARYETAHPDGLHFGKAGHEVLGQALFEAEFHACP